MSNSRGWPELLFRQNSRLISIALTQLSRISFWTAIFLPLGYIPLVAIDHHWVNELPNFLMILSLHIAVILLGMRHDSRTRKERYSGL